MANITKKAKIFVPCAREAPIERRAQVLLSIAEIEIYLDNDRAEARRLLRDLGIRHYDPRRPPRIDERIVRAWLRKRDRS